MTRFRREPDESWSWGVFDENTGEGMSAGVADDFDNAKLDALMKLLPPSNCAPAAFNRLIDSNASTAGRR